MKVTDSFVKKLENGQVVEQAICKHLRTLLPDCEVRITEQSFGASDRDRYSLVDVIVLKDNQPILGIESKRSSTPFRKCKDFCGWESRYNTPLNNTSIRKYQESTFPFYILNINQFAHMAFTADIHTILESDHDLGQKKPSGVIIYNYNSSSWMTYRGQFKLTQILQDILKKENIC